MNKPVNCGCGGEAIIYINGARQAKIYCEKCGIESNVFATKYKAIEAWNRAMGERTAKVVTDDVIITVNGYRYHYEEYFCNACKKKVFNCDSYCSHCGAKLDWSWNE